MCLLMGPEELSVTLRCGQDTAQHWLIGGQIGHHSDTEEDPLYALLTRVLPRWVKVGGAG